MKKILMIFNKETDIMKLSKELSDEKTKIILTSSDTKIFQIEDGEITKVYPEKKIKLGELEVEE